jgi:flagellar biosynthesis chaperone FliJ
MKAFVKDALKLSSDVATRTIEEQQVAVIKIIRGATQLYNTVNNHVSELDMALANAKANLDQLKISREDSANTMYTKYKPEIEGLHEKVNACTTERAALTEKVRQLQNTKDISFASISTALNGKDVTQAASLLKHLADEAEKLKEDLKKLKTKENGVMNNLIKTRDDVIQAVRSNNINPIIETKEAAPKGRYTTG